MVRPIDGRGFAFVPRELVKQPKAFGSAPGLLEPVHEVAVTSERYRAAMVQHVMASTVRAELLKSRGLTPVAFAERIAERGLGADRVRRVFRGETMAQLTDLMFWMGHFPAVAEAISEQTGAWFGANNDAEDDTVIPTTVSASTPVPVEVDRRLDALRQQMAAQRSEPVAPAVRSGPENPYVSAPRGMRKPPR
ncbi:hypothetical protein [Microbacterium sp. NPDC090003]|uniref:hypothetical protein n=1 Tax=Microbacterium sp. NPDC090003 TaxID=3364203 RepID=UPI00380D6B45